MAYLDGVEETELRAMRFVEVVLPLIHRLETVHHATIVTVCGGRNKAGDNKSDRSGGIDCHDLPESDPCVEDDNSERYSVHLVILNRYHG